MFNNLHAAHLTGTADISEVSLFYSRITFRPGYSLGEMFFKPYESKKEALFCAQQTFFSGVLMACVILEPIGALLGATIATAIRSVLYDYGSKTIASWCLDVLEHFVSSLCQMAINLIVLPLATVALVTRSLSTGLKEAHIYDYDAPSPDILGNATAYRTKID